MKTKNNTKTTFKPFEFTDQEYTAFVRIWNAYYPDEVFSPEEFKHEDELRDKKYIFQRFRVEKNGKIIGFCAYQETPFGYKPGKFMVSIYLDQDYLGISYQTLFFDFLMEEISQHNPTQLASMAREDKPERIEFYKSQGFKQVMRSPRSRLDVQSFDSNQFAPLLKKLEKENIEFISVTSLAKRDPIWISKWRIQVGPSFGIEKSKQRMIGEDIAVALTLVK